MITISSILAAILCSASPIIPQEEAKPAPVEQVAEQVAQEKTQLKMGSEVISSLRTAYQNGEYSEFLKQMHESYTIASQENQLKGLSDMRVAGFPEMKDVQKWEDKAEMLKNVKNQELLNSIADEDDSVFAKKVRSAAANLSSPDQHNALVQLSLFHLMTPKSGKTADENTLIDLDMEFEYKIIQLNSSSDPSDDRRLKQYVLQMERMEKMVVASKNFQDASLKQAVGLASANCDERLAQNWDTRDLRAIAAGKIKPSNASEEKVVSILSAHDAKFQDEFKQFLDSQGR